MPAWQPDSSQPEDLRRGLKMMAVDIDDRASFRAGAPHELFTVGLPGSPLRTFPETVPVRSYDVYPDGRHFIASLIENPTEPQVTRLNVVLNWFDELKRRVPTR